MKLKNCLGFLFYLHSLSLSPFSLTLALALPLSVLLSYPANGISGYCIFSRLFFVIFQLFFLLCLLRLCAKHHRHILNAFWAVERGKGTGDRSSIYAEWLSELPLKRQQQQPTWLDSARLEARVFDLNLAELCTATFTVSRATVSGQTGLPRVYHSNFHFEFFATFHF